MLLLWRSSLHRFRYVYIFEHNRNRVLNFDFMVSVNSVLWFEIVVILFWSENDVSTCSAIMMEHVQWPCYLYSCSVFVVLVGFLRPIRFVLFALILNNLTFHFLSAIPAAYWHKKKGLADMYILLVKTVMLTTCWLYVFHAFHWHRNLSSCWCKLASSFASKIARTFCTPSSARQLGSIVTIYT